uniref:Uncharacterized protein n=1 Tax=Noccaea caerulescens TaxID=107243 RepID=A0A1J3K7S6_NOCCA
MIFGGKRTSFKINSMSLWREKTKTGEKSVDYIAAVFRQRTLIQEKSDKTQNSNPTKQKQTLKSEKAERIKEDDVFLLLPSRLSANLKPTECSVPLTLSLSSQCPTLRISTTVSTT